jgi:serine/threonine-protein kinase
MGEVWLAYDPRLDRQVAVKRIRSHDPLDPARRSRLRREARLAASLQHPAIVQVFDLVTEGEADHIVFELVSGETLERSLAERGTPPLPRGLTIARQLAEGLAYAHARGVVHRDLKCENILLPSEGDGAKITDFGIARRTEGDKAGETLTQEGVVVGTYRAMAPEILRGRGADHRSDLFSFGVLLYELFTGSSPFLAETGPATAGRILHHRPATAIEVSGRLPPALSALIDRLLEKEPELRPRNATEVAQLLASFAETAREESDETLEVGPLLSTEADSQPAPLGDSPPVAPVSEVAEVAEVPEIAGESRLDPRATSGSSPELRPLPPPPRRRGLLATSLAAVAILVGVVIFIRPTPPPTDPLLAAVLAPALVGEKEPGESSEADDLLAFALRNGLTRAVGSFEGVYAKSAREVDAVKGPPTEVARAVAADEVLSTSLACQGGSCLVELSRIRAGDGAVLWTETLSVPRDRPLAAARAAATYLAGAFPAHPTRPGAPELAVGPEDYAAYLRLEQALSTHLGELSAEEVLDRLSNIRKSSPRFLDAYLLAASLEAQLHATSRSGPEGLDRALAYLEEARQLAPGDPEVGLLRVSVKLQAEKLEEAAADLADLAPRVPGHAALFDLSADLARREGRPREALELSRRALTLRPSWHRLYRHAQLALQEGEGREARESLERLLQLVPGHASGKWLLAWFELTQGDVGRAAHLFAEIALERPYAGSWVNLGLAHLLLGNPDAAVQAIRKAVELAPDNPLYQLNLADALALGDRFEEAVARYQAVLDLLDEEPAGSWRDLSARAQALAHLGRYREAVGASQEALRRAPQDGQALFEAALVSTLAGDRTAALVQAEKALDQGFQPRFFELPWFAALREDPDFARRLSAVHQVEP